MRFWDSSALTPLLTGDDRLRQAAEIEGFDAH